jgi:hypothetical protein
MNALPSFRYVHRLKGSDGGPHPLFNGESNAIRAWLKEREAMNPPTDCDCSLLPKGAAAFRASLSTS